MKHRILRYRTLLIVLLILALTAGCATGTALSGENSFESEDTTETNAAMLTTEYKEEDTNAAWDESTATKITLSDEACLVDGGGAKADGSTVTVTQAGTYALQGTLSNGQIRVEAGKEDTVRLIFNGVDITCADSAPIYILQCEKTILTLAEGTENKISDSDSYAYEDAEAEEPDAALFSKDDLTINGSGSLTVTALFNNGIAGKDDLVITGGRLAVTAENDGIRGRDSVSICGGTFIINAGGDGIQSNNDEESDKGFVSLDGGHFTITAASDSIQAESILQVTGGEYAIQTGGGSASASGKSNEMFGPGNRGGFTQDTETNETGDSESAKGLKAGSALFVTGGSFTVDSSDDALHSNGDVSILGGELKLSSGDDGIHADAALTMEEGSVEIVQSYEGIEGASITIRGGSLRVAASDDGLNAAGGSNRTADGGRPAQDDFSAQSGVFIRITGGYIYVDAAGDGIDSNGDLYVDGGTVIVNGPTNSQNGPLDYNGSAEITGGVLVAAGSAGMAQNFTDTSSQNSLMVNFSAAQQAGAMINLSDEQGNSIVSFTPSKNYQSVLISAPGLAQGETYILSSGGSASGEESDGLYQGGGYSSGTQVVRATLSGASTSISDTGEAVTGGMGPGGGMNRGGDMPQGGMAPGGMGNRPEGRQQ